jgi:L-threonylcarbamoyladenylate synthase
LTLVLKKTAAVPDAVSAGLDTVAVRIPSHPVARALLEAAGVPIAAPSANKSGSPSPTTAAHVAADIGQDLTLILDGGHCGVGLESTIVSLAGPIPKLLRPGGISLEAVIGSVEVDGAVFGQLQEGVAPAAPGMKYRHYAPIADVILLNGTRENVLNYMAAQKGAGILCHDGEESLFPSAGHIISLGGSSETAAHRLFAALREMDAAGVSRIYCGLPDKSGVGLAVYNRLLKAAAGRVMEC